MIWHCRLGSQLVVLHTRVPGTPFSSPDSLGRHSEPLSKTNGQKSRAKTGWRTGPVLSKTPFICKVSTVVPAPVFVTGFPGLLLGVSRVRVHAPCKHRDRLAPSSPSSGYNCILRARRTDSDTLVPGYPRVPYPSGSPQRSQMVGR